MPSLPGSKLWHSSLMGYVQVTDWDLNNGGVIQFSDGTLWSYEGESPAYGDQDEGDFPWYGFCISERKVGADAWERLTPDSWGIPGGVFGGTELPPGYPKWPTVKNETDWRNPSLVDFEGPLDVAPIGDNSSGWCHVQQGDDVWFYPRFGDEALGPVKVNRFTRRWERFITSSLSLEYWTKIRSNMVIDGEYMWFLALYDIGDSGEGMYLMRARVDDPNDVVAMKYWTQRAGSVDTSFVSFPGYLDDQKMLPGLYSIAIDDGYVYYFEPHNAFLNDTRSPQTPNYNDPSDRNYDLQYSQLRRFRIGEWTLETLIWHTSPQNWIGYGASSSYGTLLDGTVGITNQPDLTATRDNDYEAIGMGMECSGEDDMYVRDGWLYWADWSGRNFGVYGDPQMICRVQLSKLTPGTPIQHDVMNPIFEIVTNGTVPWEGNAGHWGRSGTWIWMRDGAQPIMAHADNTFSFDDEGNILFKAMAFPLHYSDSYGYGKRGIWKLTNPEELTRVTVSFTGDELQGYGNVRQVPMTREVIEVELS